MNTLTKEEIDDIARGKVWIGSKALEIGLIDEIAGIDRAIELAAELAEINDEELGVKRINRDTNIDSFFSGMMANISSSIMKITGPEDPAGITSNLFLINNDSADVY